MNIAENIFYIEKKSFLFKKKRFKYKKLSKKRRRKFSMINYIIIFIKKIIQIIEFLIKTIIEYMILGVPFFLMDYFIRKETKKIQFTVTEKYSYMFSSIYITFFILSSKTLKGNIGKIYYSGLFIFFFLLFLTNIIFFSFTSNFFYFKVLKYAREGRGFMMGVILSMKIEIWVNALLIIFSFVLALFIFRKTKTNNFLILICIFIILIFSQNYTKNIFGPIGKKNWDDFNNPKNIFKECSNPNKCLKIVGFYKYIQIDFFKTYLNFNIFRKKEEKEQLEYLKNIYKDVRIHPENEYTGRFKDKNFIFVQLEGMDIWLLNENNTPTLHSLKNNSFVFSDHYSYLISAGSTFNSEFCVNTGFYTPFTLSGNSYDFYKNSFNSLPKVFKELGYTLKSFHFNEADIYSRDINYLGWGYDKFLSLIKTNTYKDDSLAGLDTELINNKIFYDEIFNTKGKFLYYFITFSIHLPFSNNYHTHHILKKKYGNNIPRYIKKEEIAMILAGETDEMVKLLLEGLKKHNLYDDTVLVLFADHSTNIDRRILNRHKITTDNRINHTPFFIWSANMKGEIINKTSCQLDILPTVLNLIGYRFQEKSLIGRDIFDKNNLGLAFFDDYSWIDGKILYNNGKRVKLQNSSNNEIDEKYILNKTQEVRERFKQNDLTLKFDYLKYILNKK